MKKTAALILVLAMCLSLAACGSVQIEDLKGVWTGSWEYKGADIEMAVEIDGSGNYVQTSYRNGEFSKTEKGTVAVEGNKVICQINGNPGDTIEYKYSGGTLTNNGHTLTK